MTELSVLLDAYNSLARPPPGAPDPTLTGARFEDGTEVYFGQAREEVEALVGALATLASPPTSTAEIRSMLLPSLWLTFDADRLVRIGYRKMSEPPAPFRQLWKNFTPIGEQQVTIGMTKVAFWEYLEAWEKRAEARQLQKDRDYKVRTTTSERTDAFIISMRGARGWDSWVVNFTAKSRPQTVISIDASCAEFMSRPPAPSAEALQAMQKAKQKGKTGPQVDVSAMTAPEIGLPPVELPKLELKLP